MWNEESIIIRHWNSKRPVDWRFAGQIKRDLFRENDSFVINQISQHFRSHFWHKGAHDAVLFLV